MTLKFREKVKEKSEDSKKMVKQGYFQHSVLTVTFFLMLTVWNINYFVFSFYLKWYLWMTEKISCKSSSRGSCEGLKLVKCALLTTEKRD